MDRLFHRLAIDVIAVNGMMDAHAGEDLRWRLVLIGFHRERMRKRVGRFGQLPVVNAESGAGNQRWSVEV